MSGDINFVDTETLEACSHSKSLVCTDPIEQVTPKKASKRKRSYGDRSSKKSHLSPVSSDYSPTDERPRSTKKRVNVDPDELHNILDGMEDEIDSALESAATKNKLTRVNVKNILKHVITNEYVLAMVRNTMKIASGETDLEEAVFEPKLTRSKAKELKPQYTINWPSPMKKRDQVTQQLLEEEFPDESSDDEDYRPNEEEEPSDDDDAATSPRTSELWSPRTPMTESSPTPASKDVLELDEEEDENNLTIELPESNPPSEISEADKIALRTRSKFNLNNTPLEEIEATFFAPDITVDMYDTTCDDIDWLKFLSDLGKPFDNEVASEQVEADDPEDDPEYTAHEDDDLPDPLDLTDDRSTKVSRTELNALMAEILEFAQQEFMDCEDEEEERSQIFESVFTSTGEISAEMTRSEWMNSDEKMQLDEQMRMYVQLLTQVYLLSHGSPDLQFVNISVKLFMDELKMFGSRNTASNKSSAFYAHNLDNALKIINKFEKYPASPDLQNKESIMQKCRNFVPVPVFAKRTMAINKVFIYPELLPVRGFPPPFQFRKTVFTDAEDSLIAIGLEQFATCEHKIDVIQSLLLPCKSVQQIMFRIKNCKLPKVSLDNPIKYYHVHKVAPPCQRILRIFDPEKVKSSSEYPVDSLPRWMTYYCRVASGNPMFVPPPIAPCQTTSTDPPVAIVRPMFRKVPERRKSRLILPNGAVLSPLKQITPILKKYTFPKKTVTVLPFTITCPLKDKCGRFSNKQCSECLNVQKRDPVSYLRPIKPKPVLEDGNACVDSPTKFITTAEQTSTTVSQSSQIIVNSAADQNSSKSNRVGFPDQANVLQKTSAQACNQTSSSTSGSSSENNKKAISLKQSKSSGIEESVAVVDIDIDENIEDDEPDLPAAVTVTAKKQTVSKKKNRIHKDLESSLALLKPSMVSNDPKKEEREILYVNSYLLRAAETLKSEPETWNLFLMSICKYQHSTRFPVKLYLELKVILKNHPALLDDFVAFLKPAEAKLVGKFKQYLVLNKVREFLRKVEVHFSNQPQHITRIVRALSQFKQQSYVTSTMALNGLQPLLRNQTHLMEELSQLIPDAAPPV